MQDSKLITREFKFRFGIKLCLITGAGMSVLTYMLYALTSRSLGRSYAEAVFAIYDLKVRTFPLVFASFYSIAVLTLITAAIGVISTIFSHKIAGPVYRLEKTLEGVGSGDLTVSTKFRNGDQLFELAEGINAMVLSLNLTAKCLAEGLEGLKADEARLKALIEAGKTSGPEVEEAAASLRERVTRLKHTIGHIKAKGADNEH